MKQTIRRYTASSFYGVTDRGDRAARLTYHGTDHHGVCDNCGATFVHGWMVLAPTCECGREHADHDEPYCLACVTIVPPAPRTPDLA